jgi:hypothetical protein
MVRRNLRTGQALVTLALVVACVEAPPPPGAVDAATATAIRAESARATTIAARPSTGLWDLDRVSERLVRAGVNPRAVDTLPALPAFMQRETVGRFRVGRGGDLLIFLYVDSLARRAVSSTLTPDNAAPEGVVSPWGLDPHLIVSNNLIAVLVGGSTSLRERVQLAIEAGLPAPGGL